MEYLEFELPIKELEEQLQKCMVIGEESDVDVTETCAQIEKNLHRHARISIKTLPLGKKYNCQDIPAVPIPWITSMPFVEIPFWSSMETEM